MGAQQMEETRVAFAQLGTRLTHPRLTHAKEKAARELAMAVFSGWRGVAVKAAKMAAKVKVAEGAALKEAIKKERKLMFELWCVAGSNTRGRERVILALR